jgi:polysaccharide biosynthesis/export protein
MKSITVFVCLSGICCLMEAQTPPVQPAAPLPPQPELPGSVLPPQRLGTGDLVNVSVYAAPELSRPVRVASDGRVRLPLLSNPIPAANKMPDDLAKSIAEELKSEQLLVDPLVSVTVTEYGSRPVVVTGAVRHPTTFQALGETTLLIALAKADGLTPEAGPDLLVSIPQTGPDGTTSRSVRKIAVKSLMSGSDPNLNLQLHGGEEIRIPEAEKVYVVGNVKKPGTFPVKDGPNSSVLKALALSEGLLPFATKEAYIYRLDSATGQRQEIPVALSGIVERKSPDVVLEGGDIFYIPDNRTRRLTVTWLEKIAGFGATTASGLLIWRR